MHGEKIRKVWNSHTKVNVISDYAASLEICTVAIATPLHSFQFERVAKERVSGADAITTTSATFSPTAEAMES